MEYTIDAAGKKLGRVASEAASVLRGKHLPAFAPNQVPDVKVSITHAGSLDISPATMARKSYKSFSGYPGGLKTRTMRSVAAQKGYGELVKRAISGMLPKNKLRSLYLKNLTVSE